MNRKNSLSDLHETVIAFSTVMERNQPENHIRALENLLVSALDELPKANQEIFMEIMRATARNSRSNPTPVRQNYRGLSDF